MTEVSGFNSFHSCFLSLNLSVSRVSTHNFFKKVYSVSHIYINPKFTDDLFDDEMDFLTFFHGQRTGGSALRHVIGRAWTPSELYCTQNVDNFKHWEHHDTQSFTGFKGFAGHSNYEPKDIGKRLRLITLLRHPVHRNISIYYYAKKYSNQFLHHHTEGRSLSEFYYHTQRLKPKYFDNVICRRICGRPEFEPARDMIEDSYWMVGLTEYFDDFVRKLLSGLGAPAEVQPDLGSDSLKYAEEIQNTKLVADMSENNSEDLKLFNYMNTLYFKSNYDYPTV